MNFLNWFNLSPKLKRPANPALDTFACFDITPSELTQADLINENALIRLQSHFQYGAFCYELLYKRTLSTSIQYFSVFRSDRKTAAQALATRLHEVLSPLAEEINVKCFAADASVTLHEIILMAHTYSAWTCAHIAAHAGMSGVFKSPNAQIISNLNERARPLRRTPVMLATLSGDTDTVRAILSLQPDLEKLDRRLNSVLHFAAICEKDTFRAVLQQCLKRVGKRMLYQRNNRNATPLHFACYSEAIDNVLYMIQLGLVADVLVIEPPFDARSPLTSSLPIGPDSTKCIRNSRLNIVNETHQDLLPISARSSTINVETLSTQSSGSDDVNPKSSGSLRSPAKLIASNSIEIPFSNEMLEDLDVDDIKLGGSPLHWCMYRRTLERLLQYDLRLDAIDLNHETALFRCVSKHRLRCMLHLLNAGADPNLPNLVGNTCLHEAVMRADIPAVQALICWNCDVNAKNHDGHTARHLAAVANSKNHLIIVYVLYAIGAKRCEPNVTGCTGDCSATGTGSGQKFSKWADFQRPSPMEHYLNDWSILTKKESSKMKKQPISRMICFDGGGTKGLITLQVLLELQKRLKNPLHHYFDWFVGTSTGSIIASLLSLGYSLKAIQIIYYALKDRVMVGQRPYNSLLLEHVLRNILGPHVRMCDVRKKLLITATLADRSPIQLHLFRSFPSPSEILKNERQYIDRSSCGTSSKSACLTSPKSSAQPTSPATSAKQSSRKKLSSKSSISSESALDNQPLATCSHYFDGLNNANPLFIIRKLNDILSKSNVRQSSPEPSVISSVEVAKDNSSQKAGESSQSISKSVNPTNPPSPFSASNEDTSVSTQSPPQHRIEFATLPDYREQLLWRACRSSGAAPTFFRASGAFIDGGLIANNPCLDALTAFTKHNSALQAVGQTSQVKRLQVLLSIGTGKPPVIPAEVIDVGTLYSLNPYEPYQSALQALNLTQEMMTMATQTDAHVVERAHAWCRSTHVAYFRLNPPISENLQLNCLEESEIVNALWESKAYLHAQADYIELLVDLLERDT